jgi:tetratricopeptide (TPR) repeat protein
MKSKLFEVNREGRRRGTMGFPPIARSNISCVAILAGSMFFVNCSAWRLSAADNNALGMAALRAGDYAKAKDCFIAALKAAPAQDESGAGLLQALRETGAYEEASQRGDEFLSARERSAPVQLERGRVAAERGDYVRAERHFRRAVELGGAARRAAVIELADLLALLGRKEEAIALWEDLIGDYRAGRVRGSQDLAATAVAAWRRGYVQDAKDLFLDATGASAGDAVPIDALANFGYLFLEKYNATEAMGVFKDCLKINGSYPPALIGMALAKEYENSGEEEAYALSALQVNPHLVAALNLLARLKLQDEDYEGALQMIHRAQSVNAANPETLSIEAVYRFIRGDTEAWNSLKGRILGINPSYGRLYYTLAENLVAHRKYAEAVEFNRRALELDPGLWPAYAGLGMNLMRVGDLPGGRKAIQQAFDGDPFNIWAFNTLELLDQMDGFSRKAQGHFILLMSTEDAPVVGPFAYKLAEEAYTKLTGRYQFTPQEPIQVEFFPDHGGFAVRTLGLPGLGALGVCFGKVIALDSPRARKTGTFNWGSTLWHEFTHVITLQMTNHNIPRWYSEGLSVYEEHRARPGWGDDLSALFLKSYKEGKLLKVSELNAGMMRPKSPEQISLSYYQAALVCEMIEAKFGFDKIRQTLNLFAQNQPTEEVFREALGWNTATLDREYLLYLDTRLKAAAAHLYFKNADKEGVHAAVPGPADKESLEAALRKDPDDFFANLQLGALLHKDGADREAETYLRRAQKVFPEYTDPGNPYEMLGEIYLGQKRQDEALEQLLAWTKIDENAIGPLIKAADIYRERKDWAREATVLEQSIYISPYDASVHKWLGEAAMEVKDWQDAAAAYEVLLGLNPTDLAGAHYDLARALLAGGKKREAKRETLRALEVAPAFEKAQKLLLQLAGEDSSRF